MHESTHVVRSGLTRGGSGVATTVGSLMALLAFNFGHVNIQTLELNEYQFVGDHGAGHLRNENKNKKTDIDCDFNLIGFIGKLSHYE